MVNESYLGKDTLSCKHDYKKLLFQKAGIPVVECQDCGHRFAEIKDVNMHVSTVYSDSYFFEGKDGYPNYLEEEKILRSSGKRYARIISRFTKPGEMLDIGSAAGFILSGFYEAGWNCEGIEPNDTMAGYGRNHLGLKIKTGSFEQFKSDKEYDLITLIQVIGHFYDLNKAILNVSEHLKPGGFALIESWNRNSLYARLMGSNWPEYSPPSVLHYFSDTTLINQLNIVGLHLVDKGHPVKQINLKHAASFLESKLPEFQLKRKLFNFFSGVAGKLPLPYPFLDLKWYLFQKAATAGN